MDDSPVVVVEVAFVVQGRSRDDCIAKADGLSLRILAEIGGEPWQMVDDDWQRVRNPQLTISDDQGFMYHGKRSYIFAGPFVPSKTYNEHPGHRTQGGDGE